MKMFPHAGWCQRCHTSRLLLATDDTMSQTFSTFSPPVTITGVPYYICRQCQDRVVSLRLLVALEQAIQVQQLQGTIAYRDIPTVARAS